MSMYTTPSFPQVEAAPNDRPYNLAIQVLDRGYNVTVGCKTFAFASLDDLLSKVSLYLKEPMATQKKFESGELFKITL